MNTPNVGAGRLERRVRRVGKETMPGIHGFCSFSPFGAMRGKPLIAPYGPTGLRLTAIPILHTIAPYALIGSPVGIESTTASGKTMVLPWK